MGLCSHNSLSCATDKVERRLRLRDSNVLDANPLIRSNNKKQTWQLLRRRFTLVLLLVMEMFLQISPAKGSPRREGKSAVTSDFIERSDKEDEGQEGKNVYPSHTDFCSNGLRDAVNAAILELAADHFVANVLLPQFPGVPYVPILTCPVPPVGQRQPLWALSSKTKDGYASGVSVPSSLRQMQPPVQSFSAPPGTSNGLVATGHTAENIVGNSRNLLLHQQQQRAAKGNNANEAASSRDIAESHADTLWPDLADLQKNDLLLEVLTTEALRVAGLGPERSVWTTIDEQDDSPWENNALETNSQLNPSTVKSRQSDVAEDLRFFLPSETDRGYNWGPEGDYSVPSPTGYFPTYLRAILDRIGTHYRRALRLERLYYSQASDCLQSVKLGVAHMTDIYFLQAHQKGSQSLWSEYARTCPVSGSPNIFITLKEYGFQNLQDVVRHLRMSKEPAMRTIAYMSAGNYETIEFFFPAHTLAEVTTSEDAERRIAAKEILGNIRTGSAPELPPNFAVVNLGLVLAQGPYFSRTDTPHCLYHQLLVREAARKRSHTLINAGEGRKKNSSAESPLGGKNTLKAWISGALSVAISLFLTGVA